MNGPRTAARSFTHLASADRSEQYALPRCRLSIAPFSEPWELPRKCWQARHRFLLAGRSDFSPARSAYQSPSFHHLLSYSVVNTADLAAQRPGVRHWRLNDNTRCLAPGVSRPDRRCSFPCVAALDQTRRFENVRQMLSRDALRRHARLFAVDKFLCF